ARRRTGAAGALHPQPRSRVDRVAALPPGAASHRSSGRRELWTLPLLTLFMTMLSLMSHGTQDMYPTFLEKERALGPRMPATIAIIYNIGALAGGLAFGALSDRVGRRRAMVLAALGAALVIPA